LVSNYKVSDSI